MSRIWDRPYPATSLDTVVTEQNETFDVMAFEADDDLIVSQFQLTLVSGDQGKLVSGIKKLAQRFLIELLTDSQSVSGGVIRGSEFIWRIRNGVISLPSQVYTEFALAKEEIREILVSEDFETQTPSDESFLDAELTDVFISNGRVELRISLSSLAGDQREFKLPINLNYGENENEGGI